MEGVESAAVAHRQQDKSFVGGRGSATTPMTVMVMVGILDKSSKVAEHILDSRRYNEALPAYEQVLNACKKPHARAAYLVGVRRTSFFRHHAKGLRRCRHLRRLTQCYWVGATIVNKISGKLPQMRGGKARDTRNNSLHPRVQGRPK